MGSNPLCYPLWYSVPPISIHTTAKDTNMYRLADGTLVSSEGLLVVK